MNAMESWMNRVSWVGAGNQLASWVESGIQHGFEGRGYELPATGYSVKQVHGTRLIEVTAGSDPGMQLEADGLWTRQPACTIAVKTADCVPVLLQHPKLVMAVHAGWKGLAQDILGSAVGILQQEGIPLPAVRVGIGPCISLDSFEVGPEVVEQFRMGAYGMGDAAFAFASSKGERDRWHLDLGLLAALRFKHAGFAPEQLTVIRSCTRKNPLLWHSFRRDGSKAGRNWSWIRL